MTLIKLTKPSNGQSKNLVYTSPVTGMIENLLSNDIYQGFTRDLPAVNIAESKDSYIIELYAPGFKKENFHLQVEKNVLSISGEIHKTEADIRYTKREFSPASFRRTFGLPGTVVIDNISAKYQDGILFITLPKKEEAREKPAREIKID